METRLFHLHALSALHVGTGQGVGAVDLPIARSRATNLPIVAGSAIKGVLRDELKSSLGNSLNTLFGSEGALNDEAKHAGSVAFGDAHLLLLPIRSFAGTVAYATCPFILKRYQRDTKIKLEIPEIDNTAKSALESLILISGNKIALEDLDMDAETDDLADKWAKKIAEAVYPDNQDDWQKELTKRFVILPDNVFSFLADTATEIRTRIKIDRETRIVAKGALWTEENLPCETVLWGVFGVAFLRDKDNKKTAEELSALLPEQEITLQIGGKHTVGRGLCRLLIGKLGDENE